MRTLLLVGHCTSSLSIDVFTSSDINSPLACLRLMDEVVFQTIRGYMLPPSSGSKCVGYTSFCVCVALCFGKTMGGSGS
jgi:hypothetical protein